MLQIFIALIVVSFLGLFAMMSLPILREHDSQGEKSKKQPQD